MRVHARLKSIPSLPSLSFSIALLPFHFSLSLSLNIILPLAYLPIEILRIFLFFLLNDWDRDKNYSWLERLDSVKREYKFDEFCISKKFLNSFLIFAFSFSLECFSPSTFFSLPSTQEVHCSSRQNYFHPSRRNSFLLNKRARTSIDLWTNLSFFFSLSMFVFDHDLPIFDLFLHRDKYISILLIDDTRGIFLLFWR